MSRNRIETIKNIIINKVKEMTHLKNVYGYDVAFPNGYPYAVVLPADFDGSFGDFSAVSKRNLRNWTFIIRVFVERDESSFGVEKAQRVMEETVDELLIAFDNYQTLGGEVQQVQVVSGSFNSLNIGSTINTADLIINCLDVVQAS